MSLDALRKSLKAKTEALAPLKEKVANDNATETDVSALETAISEIKAIAARMKAIEEADAAAAAAAAPANQRITVPAQVKQHRIDDSGMFSVGVAMAGMAFVKSGHAANLREALEMNGFTAIADQIENKTQKQLASTGGTGAGLVLPTMASDIIEFLRPATTFIACNPRRVPLTNGTYFQPKGNIGAQASYGRENSVPAYSEATFTDVNLSAKELQGKTAISNLLISRGVQAIRAFVEDDLRSRMGEVMDLNMYLGDGAALRPTGLYTTFGIATRAAADTLTPTAAQVDADSRWAINSLGSANVNLSTAQWVMSLETAGFLEDMRDGNGNFLYPQMQGPNKVWKNFPVRVTTNLPTNLGVGSNRSHISLIAYTHVIFGEEDGIAIRASSDAAYTDGGGNMRSAFERDETLMIAVARHDLGLRHKLATSLLTDVRWGR